MAACTSATHRASIRRHFAGSISRLAERGMRQHLIGCADCRDYYDRHLLLARIDPTVAPPRQRLAVGLGLASPRSAHAPFVGALAMAAAAALLLFRAPFDGAISSGVSAEHDLASPPEEPSAPLAPLAVHEFSARGATVAEPELLLYRLPRGGKPERAQGHIGRGDELAISYSNPPGYEQLLVFGVDEHGHVYWYYPAWTDARENPSAIRIEPASSPRELPDAVAQELDGAELRVVGVFSRAPHSVREIEAQLKRAPQARLNLPGTFEVELRLRVEDAP